MTRTYNTTADRSKITEIVLGQGQTLVSHSVDYRGAPAITFSPAPISGKPGDDYVPEGTMELGEGTVVLVFTTAESVVSHMERLKLMVDDLVAKGLVDAA